MSDAFLTLETELDIAREELDAARMDADRAMIRSGGEANGRGWGKKNTRRVNAAAARVDAAEAALDAALRADAAAAEQRNHDARVADWAPAAKIDLSVEAEPARDDLANALQMLQLAAAGAPGTHAVTMYRADFEAVITRLQAALTKIDARVTA